MDDYLGIEYSTEYVSFLLAHPVRWCDLVGVMVWVLPVQAGHH